MLPAGRTSATTCHSPAAACAWARSSQRCCPPAAERHCGRARGSSVQEQAADAGVRGSIVAGTSLGLLRHLAGPLYGVPVCPGRWLAGLHTAFHRNPTSRGPYSAVLRCTAPQFTYFCFACAREGVVVDGPLMAMPPHSSPLSSLLIYGEAAIIRPTRAASHTLGPMRHIIAPCLHGYCFTCLVSLPVVWRCAIAYRAVADACRAYMP